MSAILRGASFAIVAVSLVASAAQAHLRLVSASPAPNVAVFATGQIQLLFNERLVSRFSGADILRDGGRGHAARKINSSARIEADGTTLTITPARPLAKGTYRLAWHVVSVDTHRVNGNYSFQVR